MTEAKQTQIGSSMCPDFTGDDKSERVLLSRHSMRWVSESYLICWETENMPTEFSKVLDEQVCINPTSV